MKKKEGGSGWAAFFSGLCVLGALALLMKICSICYPSVQRELQALFMGMEDGAVRQAFGTLAEGLETGAPVRETLAQTVQILFS